MTMIDADSDIQQLLDDLRHAARWCTPVRIMEAMLAHGAAAAAPVRELLRPAAEPRESAATETNIWLYAAQLLGELPDPGAASLLADVVRRTARDELPVRLAAAEALASLGEPALDTVRELATSSESRDRLWAYYAAGRMDEPAAGALLLNALESDPTMADAATCALADRGDAAAIEPIYRALCRAEPWQRPEFETALQDLHSPDTSEPAASEDWRLRYRLNAANAQHPLTWAVISDIVWDERGKQREVPPLRPLADILAEPRRPAERCECCDVETWQSMRMPTCPRTAVLMPLLLATRIEHYFGDEPEDDAFDVLDAIETELLDLTGRPEPRGRRSRERHEDRVAELQLMLAATSWAIEQGAESMDEILAALREEGERARSVWGEPEELRPARRGAAGPSPAAPPAVAAGRNDPCPCGSGRKFKKCHGAGNATVVAGCTAAPAGARQRHDRLVRAADP